MRPSRAREESEVGCALRNKQAALRPELLLCLMTRHVLISPEWFLNRDLHHDLDDLRATTVTAATVKGVGVGRGLLCQWNAMFLKANALPRIGVFLRCIPVSYVMPLCHEFQCMGCTPMWRPIRHGVLWYMITDVEVNMMSTQTWSLICGVRADMGNTFTRNTRCGGSQTDLEPSMMWSLITFPIHVESNAEQPDSESSLMWSLIIVHCFPISDRLGGICVKKKSTRVGSAQRLPKIDCPQVLGTKISGQTCGMCYSGFGLKCATVAHFSGIHAENSHIAICSS